MMITMAMTVMMICAFFLYLIDCILFSFIYNKCLFIHMLFSRRSIIGASRWTWPTRLAKTITDQASTGTEVAMEKEAR